MPTSGVTAFSMTAGDMVRAAMGELGITDSPTAQEQTDAITRLNSMLKSWQAKGCNLWRQEDTEITVTGGTATVSLDVGIRNVFSARHVVTATNERPLGPLERDEYLSLPNKAAVGNPSCYYVGKARDGLTLYVWPVPSSNQTLKIDNERIVETVTSHTQEVDVPQEWSETVWKCLAARIANMFGSAQTDPATVAKVVAEARELERDLFDDDRPAAVHMGAW